MLQSVPVLSHSVSSARSAMRARGSPSAVRAGSWNLAGSSRAVTATPPPERSRVRATRRAAAELAQPAEGIDAGRVAVAPIDLDRVAAHRLDVQRAHVLRDRGVVEAVLPTPLVDARRAAAREAEPAHLVEALVAVRPSDAEGARP